MLTVVWKSIYYTLWRDSSFKFASDRRTQNFWVAIDRPLAEVPVYREQVFMTVDSCYGKARGPGTEKQMSARESEEEIEKLCFIYRPNSPFNRE